jgi:autotransporter-associated beta strand protein
MNALVLVIFAGMGSTSIARAQFSLTGTSYNQNFDSIGNTATATLPDSWRMSAGGAGATAGFSTGTNLTATNQQSSSGSPTAGGRYNWGESAGTDRAIGFMTSGSYGSPNSIMFAITNNTGGTITAMNLAFDVERYRINTAAANVTFFTSTDGTTWTSQPAGDTGAFATGTSSYTFSSTTQTIVNRTPTITGLNVASGQSYFFRWLFNTTGSSSQGLGLDNFTLNATISAGLTTFTYTGTGTPPAGIFQNGTQSKFDAVFANSLTNPVVFTGIGESVAVTGAVQAGNLTFSANGYTLTGGVADTLEIGGIGSVTVATGASASIGAALVGTTGLTKSGPGTLALTNPSNTFTGTVNIAAGVLSIDDSNQLGNAANSIALSGGTLSFTNGIGIARTITGSGGLDIPTGGVVIASGTFNTTAVTLTNQGTLSLQGTTPSVGNLSFSAAGSVIAPGAIAATGVTASLLTAGTATVGPAITFSSGDKTVDVGSGGTLVLSGNITGGTTNRIIKTGLGTLRLAGDNSAIGGIRVGLSATTPTAGGVIVATNTLSFGPASSIIQHNFGSIQATVPLVFGYSLSIGGRTNGPAEFGGTNALEFQGTTSFFRSGGTSGEMRLNVNNTTTLSGVVSGATGSGTSTGITLGGTGMLILGGTAPNAVADNLTLADSLFVSAAKAGALGASAVITIGSAVTPTLPTLDTTANSGYTLGGGTALQTIRGVGILAGPLTLESLGRIQGGTTGSVTADNTLNAGPITLNSGATFRTIVGDATPANTLANPQASLVSLGTNTLTKGTSASPYTISLFNDGTLEDGLSYTVTVATFASTTGGLSDTDFVLVAENFSFSGTPVVSLTATTLVITFTPVPEPGALLGLAAAGLSAAGWARRRRSAI